jgi:hypothetical protein
VSPAEVALLRKQLGMKPAADPTAPWSADESTHQRNLLTWCSNAKATMPELAWVYAVPNGLYANKASAGKAKAEGMKAGVFDLGLDVARHGFHGLKIELKVPKVPAVKGVSPSKPAGRPSPEQLAWHQHYLDNGYRAEFCYGWEAAAEILKEYLS